MLRSIRSIKELFPDSILTGGEHLPFLDNKSFIIDGKAKGSQL